jgi:hypothetical protein
MSEDLNIVDKGQVTPGPDPSSNEFLGFIIDNKVQLTMITDERMSAIFRSHPVVIDLRDRPNAEQITVGSNYDPITGKIIPEQPYPSWALDPETDNWMPPTPKPETPGYWIWSEDDVEWINIPIDEVFPN